MRTDKSTYAPGEPVMIDVTERDTSAAPCLDTALEMGGCWGATASNSTGQGVWESWAGPDGGPVNCPAEMIPTTIPGGFSTSGQLTWAQDDCTQPATYGQPNPDCPQAQVPPGTYQITAFWTTTTNTSAPVTIDIASS